MTPEEYKNKKLDLYRNITGDPNFDKESVLNDELCERCEGACCKTFPCTFSPYDFVDIDDFEYMKSILDTGYFVISYYYEEDECIYYIRAKGLNDRGVVAKSKAKPNECILLGEKGCQLDFYSRPTLGALLEPKSNKLFMCCKHRYSMDQLTKDWLKYQQQMLKLKKYYLFKKRVPNKGKIYKLERIIRQDEI